MRCRRHLTRDLAEFDLPSPSPAFFSLCYNSAVRRLCNARAQLGVYNTYRNMPTSFFLGSGPSLFQHAGGDVQRYFAPTRPARPPDVPTPLPGYHGRIKQAPASPRGPLQKRSGPSHTKGGLDAQPYPLDRPPRTQQTKASMSKKKKATPIERGGKKKPLYCPVTGIGPAARLAPPRHAW